METSSLINKFNIHVIGNGTKTIVFAHGFGSDQTAWRYQIENFVSDYRIVLFDYLGCGKSDISDYSPIIYNSLNSYKKDLLEIYKTLELRQTIFVGHSVSAMIGMLASFDQPEYFEKMIFVGASPRYLNDNDYIGGFEQSDLNVLYTTMADNYLAWANGFAPIIMANPDRPELGREFAQTLLGMRPDIAQSIARIIFQSDLRLELSRIHHPVLILQSNNDIAVPIQVGKYLSYKISNSKYKLLNSEGHLPHLSAPNEVNRYIKDFI